MSLKELDGQIKNLADEWYRLIGADHHKDRDCHFYVEKKWSYGDTAVYTAYHNGYVADDWYGPTRQDPLRAHEDLLEFLKRIVANYKEQPSP